MYVVLYTVLHNDTLLNFISESILRTFVNDASDLYAPLKFELKEEGWFQSRNHGPIASKIRILSGASLIRYYFRCNMA